MYFVYNKIKSGLIIIPKQLNLQKIIKTRDTRKQYKNINFDAKKNSYIFLTKHIAYSFLEFKD